MQNYFYLFLALWLSLLSSATNAQTVVDPITGQISIVIDPVTGQTLNITQSQPLEDIRDDPAAVNVSPWLGDDGRTHITLPFEFDYYDQQFNSVWMMSNGVLSFTGQGGGYCCQGEDISQLAENGQTYHNYIIAAAWNDLFTLGQNGYYLGTEESATFGWYDVFEYYDPNNLNSFEIELYSMGTIDIRYGGMDITNHMVSAGVTGNLSQGQYVDLYYGQGFSIGAPIIPETGGPDPCDTDPLSSPSCAGYQQAYYNQQCSANPLYDVGCPGYQQAYYNQQCTNSPLYDSGCPGYQQAYHDQQCSMDALYSSDCPGYQQAYYNQQCAGDPLYDIGCSGYQQAYYNLQCSNNSLYDSGCPGYEQAYYTQQCSISPLYDVGCNGYQQAYYNQQCQLDPLYDSGCPGYAQAYYNQQCSADPLYDTGCNGYAQAYYDQQCSNSPLYDSGCPGYTEAVFQQNCSIDPLFSQQCPGFAEAIALKIAQEQQDQMFSEELIVSPDVTVDPGQTTGDPVLDQLLSVLPEPIELTTIQDEIVQTVAVEEVVATAPIEEPTPEDEAEAEEMLDELVNETSNEKSDGKSDSKEKSDGEKSKPNADKQKAAVAAKIAELKKELASGAASAKEVAAIQAQLSVLISFVPGFDQYYIVLPDSPFYQQEQVYQNQQLPQNKDALRFGLASELKHDEMVQMQYDRRQ